MTNLNSQYTDNAAFSDSNLGSESILKNYANAIETVAIQIPHGNLKQEEILTEIQLVKSNYLWRILMDRDFQKVLQALTVLIRNYQL